MHRLFNIFIFFNFICSLYSQSKEQMITSILEKSKNYEQIEQIIPIIEKYSTIREFVPLGSPILSKDNPIITSYFGYRIHPIQKTKKLHSGIDLKSEYATTIHATANGEVVFAGKKGGYGKCVIIEHKFGYSTLYAHMTIYYTKKGKIIKKGDVIGFLGSTGNSTGNHLHYEIIKNNIKINPQKWIK